MATYLVTGANRGIGYEYCCQLQARGDSAITVCPEASKELKAVGIRVEEGIDITSDDSVANLDERLGETQIDVLINNAAIASGTNGTRVKPRVFRLKSLLILLSSYFWIHFPSPSFATLPILRRNISTANSAAI